MQLLALALLHGVLKHPPPVQQVGLSPHDQIAHRIHFHFHSNRRLVHSGPGIIMIAINECTHRDGEGLLLLLGEGLLLLLVNFNLAWLAPILPDRDDLGV